MTKNPTIEQRLAQLNRSRSQWPPMVAAAMEAKFGVTLTNAGELVKLVGGQRKRQGYVTSRHTRAVFGVLDYVGKALYSRWGNHSLRINPLPVIGGEMEQDVFMHLVGNDVVIVADKHHDVSGMLLRGDITFETVELGIDSDIQPVTRTRIYNAADVEDIVNWMKESW